MTKEQEFRKQTEEAKFEAFSLMCKKVAELEAQIEKMKAELHHRLVSLSHDDSDCLDKIIGLDRLWQFGQEF